MPTILGVNLGRTFFGGPEVLRKKSEADKFAEKKLQSNFAAKFAEPKENIHPNPLCRTSGSTIRVNSFADKKPIFIMRAIRANRLKPAICGF